MGDFQSTSANFPATGASNFESLARAALELLRTGGIALEQGTGFDAGAIPESKLTISSCLQIVLLLIVFSKFNKFSQKNNTGLL